MIWSISASPKAVKYSLRFHAVDKETGDAFDKGIQFVDNWTVRTGDSFRLLNSGL